MRQATQPERLLTVLLDRTLAFSTTATQEYRGGGKLQLRLFTCRDALFLGPWRRRHAAPRLLFCRGRGSGGRPAAAFFCGRTVMLDTVNDGVWALPEGWADGYHMPSRETVLQMVDRHYPSTGVLWRREVLDSVGTFGRWGSDDNFIVRASARYPFVSSTIETAILVNHAESFSMDPKRANRETVAGSTHFDYVIGHCYQLQADILADQMTLGSRSGDVLNRGDRAAIVQRVSERLRADILWWFVYRTLPWAARDEIQTLRRHLRSLGAPRWQTLTLSATESLARRSGAAFWLLSTTARSIVALRERRRLGRLRQRALYTRTHAFVRRAELAARSNDAIRATFWPTR